MQYGMWPAGGTLLAPIDIKTNLSQLSGTFNEQLVWRGGLAGEAAEGEIQ